jgi:type II secretory pathway component GspD/PulD (secretin)
MVRLSHIAVALLLALIPSGISSSQVQGPWGEPIVVQIIQLEHANAEYLATVLQPFLSKDGRITACDSGNILVIKDRKSIVAELVKVIKGQLASDD